MVMAYVVMALCEYNNKDGLLRVILIMREGEAHGVGAPLLLP